MIAGLCWSCKTFKELPSWDEESRQGTCRQCLLASISPVSAGLAYLAATVPFHVGDRVECRTAAKIYDGIGTVEEVSMSLEHGGTMVYPTFRVRITDKVASDVPDEAYYTEVCLTRV